MKALNGYTDGDVKFKVDVYEKVENTLLWPTVVQKYDIIYLNYTANAWQFAAMGTFARKYNKKIIFDLDDAIWHIKADNRAAEAWKGTENLTNLTAICREVDYITCTNSYLKNIINHSTNKNPEKIKVFPNYIDLNLYNHRSPFKDSLDIRLTHFGSTTHFISLQEEEFVKGIDRIMKEYPNVTFQTIGAFIPKFKENWGARYINEFGHQDVYQWVKSRFPQFMDETDIIVTPLTVDKYNQSKSSIKFLEASSAMKPGVWQDIRQYQEVIKPGVNGFLATKSTDWYQAIKTLIDDVELRRSMGEEAFNTVVNDWQVQNHVKDYAEFFKKVLDY